VTTRCAGRPRGILSSTRPKRAGRRGVAKKNNKKRTPHGRRHDASRHAAARGWRASGLGRHVSGSRYRAQGLARRRRAIPGGDVGPRPARSEVAIPTACAPRAGPWGRPAVGCLAAYGQLVVRGGGRRPAGGGQVARLVGWFSGAVRPHWGRWNCTAVQSCTQKPRTANLPRLHKVGVCGFSDNDYRRACGPRAARVLPQFGWRLWGGEL